MSDEYQRPAWAGAPGEPARPLDLTDGLPPAPGEPTDYTTNLPVAYRRRRLGLLAKGLAVAFALMLVAILWLTFTAPLSKSLEPPAPPSITLLAADGTPIARRGAVIGDPVDAASLPEHVTGAFVAIEDRRFRSHWGIDPRGITRAMWRNLSSGGWREGGSTITQQLAKNAFLDSDRTFGRKFQEVLIAMWLEAWLSKDEILSRYLSNAYFGDNVYGLTAAARHYFNKKPSELRIGEAAMLAGLVKAPSRLAPTGNLQGARDRQKLVVAAMAETGVIDAATAREVAPARLRVAGRRELPNGTYFADWVLPAARDRAGEIASEQTVRTTLDMRMQRAAERAVRNARLRKAQVALVAMRPDGRIVAMVGGRDYGESPFNRATQARRQPGSTFKLFVYLAALRSGMTPDTMVDDSPVTIGNWSPQNSSGRYSGPITLEQAFAQSSNVAAARLIQQVGPRAVIRAARDLGISTPVAEEASIALGTSTVSLLELTAAYAAIAAGEAPVRPRGLEVADEPGWLAQLQGMTRGIGRRDLEGMRRLLAASAQRGTGRSAALAIDTYGKTGTTQDNRDALFVGYAGDLVVGVWLGNDDNTPNGGLAGGGLPARIWRDFMTRALGTTRAVADAPEPALPEETIDIGNITEPLLDEFGVRIEGPDGGLPSQIRGPGFDLKIGRDGSLSVDEGGSVPGDRMAPPREPRTRNDREPAPDRQRAREFADEFEE